MLYHGSLLILPSDNESGVVVPLEDDNIVDFNNILRVTIHSMQFKDISITTLVNVLNDDSKWAINLLVNFIILFYSAYTVGITELSYNQIKEVLLIVVVVSDGELVVGGSVMLHLNTTIQYPNGKYYAKHWIGLKLLCSLV